PFAAVTEREYWIMKICFSTAEEFLTELTREAVALQVEDNIVRLTYVQQQANGASSMRLSVYAGAVMRGKIVELRHYVGDLGRLDRDAETRQKAEVIKSLCQ